MTKEFTVTPAIKWLETNIERLKKFDGVFQGYMFDIFEDHTCMTDGPESRCYWEMRDEERTWRFESDNEFAEDEIEWAHSNHPDRQFNLVLELAQESPLYKAIAQ